MKLHTGMVLYFALVCFQSKPILSQWTNNKEILKSPDMQLIPNAPQKLLLKKYLKMKMLNQARILLQTFEKKKKTQIFKIIKYKKINLYKLRLS